MKTKNHSNCGAWCINCGKQNIFYSVSHGSYIYYCLNCEKWLNKYREVSATKEFLKIMKTWH